MRRVAFTLSLAAVFLATPAFPSIAAPAAAEAAAPSAPPATTQKGRVKSGARLDEVHIKGEIPEPQVLFVVGRERRRFLDFQHRRYLVAPQGMGPTGRSWVRVVDTGRAPLE